MTRPAIMDMTAEELRGAARVLRDLHAVTLGCEAYGIRMMMEREATIAEAILANSEESDEAAQDGLADAVADHLAQEASSPAPSTRVAPSAPAPESGQVIWTEERKALLAARYPGGEHEDDLLAAVNALPGIKVASALAVNRQAIKMGLRRTKRARKRFTPEGLAAMRAAAERARAARMEKAAARRGETPAPQPAAPIATALPNDGSPPDWDGKAEDEARTMMAAGKGARDLSHWFGGSLTWWQAWCERERAGERSAA